MKMAPDFLEAGLAQLDPERSKIKKGRPKAALDLNHSRVRLDGNRYDMGSQEDQKFRFRILN